MRVSTNRDDPGYANLRRAFGCKVFLDGVEQKGVLTADEGLCEVEVAARNGDGDWYVGFNGELVTEKLYGQVRIELPDRPPRQAPMGDYSEALRQVMSYYTDAQAGAELREAVTTTGPPHWAPGTGPNGSALQDGDKDPIGRTSCTMNGGFEYDVVSPISTVCADISSRITGGDWLAGSTLAIAKLESLLRQSTEQLKAAMEAAASRHLTYTDACAKAILDGIFASTIGICDSDKPGIAAAPKPPEPKTEQPHVHPACDGLGRVADFDHRLGLWP